MNTNFIRGMQTTNSEAGRETPREAIVEFRYGVVAELANPYLDHKALSQTIITATKPGDFEAAGGNGVYKGI